MIQNPCNVSYRTPARGLATLALLKANFDMGRDHIDMFIPFLLDVIEKIPANNFSGDDIRREILSCHGFDIPSHTLATLLGRVTGRFPVRREGGRYFKSSDFASPIDIDNKRLQFEAEHSDIAKDFVEFAQLSGIKKLSEEDALALIFEFLTKNHVWLLLEMTPEARLIKTDSDRRIRLGRIENRITARYILDRYRTNPHITACLRNMLDGFVLQNALFLRDIGHAPRRFSNLNVFFDTGIVLEAIGLKGKVAANATREMLDLLRDTGAHLSVFTNTLNEVKRILKVYEIHLATPDGIATLRQREVTRYVVTNYLSPSDIREIASLLEKNIRDLGIKIIEFPERELRFTLNERDLTHRIMRPSDTELHPRVTHDVDCIAAILTLRRGHTSHSLDDSVAVFSTSTGLIVKHTREWFTEEGQTGIPPVIHQIALSSAAWLKKPASAAQLKLHELVALCAAAVLPSERLWDRFIFHLKKLREDKLIRSDEMVAIIASQMIDGLLSEIDEDIDLDSNTVDEIIQRVRADYQEEAYAKVAEVKDRLEQEIRAARAATKDSEAQKAKETEHRRRLELHLLGKSRKLSEIFSWIIFGVIAFFIVGGSTTSIPRFLPQYNLAWRIARYMIPGVSWLVAISILIWGGHLTGWRKHLSRQIQLRLQRYFGLEKK